jgi:hypothetical protein
MKIEQRITIDLHSTWCGYNSLDIEDVNENKVMVRMTDDQFIELAERLEAKREYILEKRKEKLEEQNAEADS